MPTTLQFRRYDTANIANTTGAAGEIFIDLDKETVVVQDGSTAGGFPLAREGAYTTANGAYAQANNARDTANGAYAQANGAYGQANGAYGQANGAYGQANGAYSSANGAYAQANGAYAQANGAYAQANGAYDAANNAKVTVFANSGTANVTTQTINFVNTSTVLVSVANTSGNANVSLELIGTPYDQANSARDQANAAYADSNTRVLKAGDTMTGALNVQNYLKANVLLLNNTTLSGPSNTSFDGERIRLYDFNQAGHPNYAIGVEGSHIWHGVDDIGPTLGFKWYGNTTLVGLLRTNSTFEVSNTVSAKVLKASGTGTAVDASSGNILTNKVTGTEFAFLNGSYITTVRANNSQIADYTFRLPSSGGTDGFVLATDGTGNTLWSNGIYELANVVRDQANTARDTANGAYGQANGAYAQANGGFGQANGAYAQANGAYSQANGAYAQANGAYGQANLKVSLAGDTMTGNLNVAATLITQNIIPDLNVTYSIGTPDKRFKDIYLSGGTIYLGDAVLSATEDEMRANTFNAAVSVIVGGKNVLDTANGAYAQANGAYGQANGAYAQANGAYAQANSARDVANGAYAQANGAYGQANGAYGQANGAYAQANGAYDAANNAKVTVYANSGSPVTTQVINYVNTSTVLVSVANTSGNANVTFDLVGTPYDQANAARSQANAAYAEANLKLNLTGGSLSGDLTIGGNLFVTGSNTFLNVSTLSVNDSMILLSNGAVGDAFDIGFVGHFDRGANATHAGLIRKATENRFYLFDNYEVEPSNNIIDINGNNFRTGNLKLNTINADTFITTAGLDVTDQANTARTQANSARDQANTARDTANGAYAQANGAYGQANGAYGQANGAYGQANGAYASANGAYAQANGAYAQANGAYNAANNAKVTVFANSGAANVTTQVINFINTSSLLVTVANTSGNANVSIDLVGTPYDQANAARLQANTARTTANDAYGQANGAYTAANNAKVTVFANSGAANATTQTINFVNTATVLVTVANTAGNANITMSLIGTPYDQANSARDQANTARTQANTAYDQANSAYGAANNRVLKAGDTMTGILVAAGIRNTKNTVDGTNANTSTGAANNINLDESNFFTRTLTASVAFTFRNAPASGNAQSFTLVIVQNATGGYTPSFTNTVYWAGASAPPATTAANARDVWQFTTFDGGTTYYGTLSIKNAG